MLDFTFPTKYCFRPLKNISPEGVIVLSCQKQAVSLYGFRDAQPEVPPKQLWYLLSSSSTLTQKTECPPTLPNATATSASCSPSSSGSNSPQRVGVDAVPNLHLPKTVLSSVDSSVGVGGTGTSGSRCNRCPASSFS